jgi:hypothetical protein
VIGLLLACAGSIGETGLISEPEPLAPLHTPLAPVALLRRMSLDLRGVLPSTAEQDAVADDPERLDSLRDAYLLDPRLEDRLVALWAEQFHTLLDVFAVEVFDYGLDPELEYAFERAVGEEPLRLMARVVTRDLPFSDIVTADWTLSEEILAQVWPLEREPGEGWQVARYTDSRPAAGVLSTNGLWWRYITNYSNQNRARAAAISRLLVCEDYLAKPVAFEAGFSLNDADGAANAIRTVPSCQACHASLEPIAAALFGFWWIGQYSALEMTTYHPEREQMAEEILGVTPEWFGTPLTGLADLGRQIALDSRFYRCGAERAAQALWRRPVELTDFARVDGFRKALLERGSYLDLMRAILADEIYQAGIAGEADPDEQTRRLLTSDLLDSLIADLTGFSWTFEGYEMLLNDTLGHRVLVGGVDGYSVYRPQKDPGLTWALVIKRVAEAAAGYVVDQELFQGNRRLLCCADLGTGPDSDAFIEELLHLHWRLYGTAPDDARLAADTELWQVVNDERGAGFAWQAETVSVGGVRFTDHYERPSVRAFFDSYASRVCLLNGFEVRSITHERCRQLLLCGSSNASLDDWGAIIAGHATTSPLLPHAVLSGPAFSTQFTDRVVRVGSQGQLEDLLDGSALRYSDVAVSGLPTELQDPVDAYVLGLAKTAETRAADARALSVSSNYRRALEDLAALQDLGGLYLTSQPLGCMRDLASDCAAAFDLFSQGLARCAVTEFNGWCDQGWDTHQDNDMQSVHWETLFEGLNLAMADLDARPGVSGAPLVDEVVVCVLSEMGRSPKRNAWDGKDHWTFTSAMLLGAGVKGGQVIGELDDEGIGRPVDLDTGEVTTHGTALLPGHLGATLLALADVDPEPWVSQGESPIGALMV